MYVCVFVYVYAYTCLCVDVYVYINMYLCICVCVQFSARQVMPGLVRQQHVTVPGRPTGASRPFKFYVEPPEKRL